MDELKALLPDMIEDMYLCLDEDSKMLILEMTDAYGEETRDPTEAVLYLCKSEELGLVRVAVSEFAIIIEPVTLH